MNGGCLLAWTSVDGSLLKPVVPAMGEAFEDIVGDLDPLVDAMVAERLRGGLSSEDAVAAFHSTDMFGPHYRKLETFYEQKRRSFNVHVAIATPKGDAHGASIAMADSDRTLIVGEPIHDTINLRRAVTPKANDSSDFIIDHQDMINRLSAPLHVGPKAKPTIDTLSAPATGLLKRAVLISAYRPFLSA